MKFIEIFLIHITLEMHHNYVSLECIGNMYGYASKVLYVSCSMHVITRITIMKIIIISIQYKYH